MDTVDKATRSKIMSRIRSKGNRSTEWKMRMALVSSGIKGWKMHPKGLIGKPDFIFEKHKIAIFVDGCFWHGCPRCGHLPKTNEKYWHKKILGNAERDAANRKELRKSGWLVVRIWEHDLLIQGKSIRFVKHALAKQDVPATI